MLMGIMSDPNFSGSIAFLLLPYLKSASHAVKDRVATSFAGDERSDVVLDSTSDAVRLQCNSNRKGSNFIL